MQLQSQDSKGFELLVLKRDQGTLEDVGIGMPCSALSVALLQFPLLLPCSAFCIPCIAFCAHSAVALFCIFICLFYPTLLSELSFFVQC